MKTIKAKDWRKYNYYRRLNEEIIIPAFEMIGEKYQADGIRQCGNFVNVISCAECGTKHFGGFNSCTNRWCLNCLHKRITCWLAKLIPVFESWYADGNYVSMLNFTVRDGDNLKEVLQFIEDSYRTMYHGRKKNGEKERRDYWTERFLGGIRSLEVKIGKNSGKWHPHIHCLVMQKQGEYIKDYDWVSQDWHGIVGFKTNEVRLLCDGSSVQLAEPTRRRDGTPDYDWNGNVFIKKVSGKKNENILKAVCETLKYIVKVDERMDSDRSKSFFDDPDRFGEAFYALKGKRQTSTWGLLYGLQKDVDEAFEKGDYQQLKDFICQRCGCSEGHLMKVLYGIVADAVLYDIDKQYKKNSPKGTESTAQ